MKQKLHKLYNANGIRNGLILTALLGVLTSCGVSNVTVSGTYPSPNVSKIPLSIGVYYDDVLRNYSYIEYSETGSEEFDIQSGQSHMDLFNVILPAMFDQVVLINSLEEAEVSGVDAIFMPAIEEFQLALPYKTKLDVYEVWIKYNMRLQATDGEYIADWVITSYGKTPTATFGSREASINQAAFEALRDLGSSFSFTFAEVPEVRAWLATR